MVLGASSDLGVCSGSADALVAGEFADVVARGSFSSDEVSDFDGW